MDNAVEIATKLHQRLVNRLKGQGYIRSASVEHALRTVPRHLFVPGHPLVEVYDLERAIGVRASDGGYTSDRTEAWKSSCSQPAVYPILLEQLDLQRGHRVLEIGAGTGYNAALMAQIVGESGRVVTIDIDEDLVTRARQHLAKAGFPWVRVVCGDGVFGCPAEGPYDRIILTVSAWDIAPAWREQLKPDGRLLLPLALADPGQQLTIAFEPREGYLESVSISDCSFMGLRGALAAPQGFIGSVRVRSYAAESGLTLPPDQMILQKPWSRLEITWPTTKS